MSFVPDGHGRQVSLQKKHEVENFPDRNPGFNKMLLNKSTFRRATNIEQIAVVGEVIHSHASEGSVANISDQVERCDCRSIPSREPRDIESFNPADLVITYYLLEYAHCTA